MAKRKFKKKGWIKPDGMSKKMGEEVLAGKICGAKRCKMPGTEDAHFCRQKPCKISRETREQPPYRCARHGGATGNKTHFKPGHKINVTHGLYTDAMDPEEWEIHDKLQVGNVDAEIKMCKMRLRRAMVMEWRQRKMLDAGKTGDDESKESSYLKETSKKVFTEMDEAGKKIGESRVELAEVRAHVNYSRAVKDITNELYKLEQIRTLQLQAGSGESDHDRAKRVQAEIAKIKASIEVVEATIVDGDGAGEAIADPTQAAAAKPDKIGPFEKGGGDVDEVDDEDGDNDDGDERGL